MSFLILSDRIKMTVASAPGTGTVSLGSAFSDSVNGDCQTFAQGGVQNGQFVAYLLVDGHAWEYGRGQYLTAGQLLSRGPINSSAGGLAINASNAAVVSISPSSADLFTPLAKINPGQFNRVTLNELVAIAAGSPAGSFNFVDILNISPGIPGYVEYIHWDILSANVQSPNNCLIQVFVDGEATPSLKFDMAGILGTASANAGRWWTKFIDCAIYSISRGDSTFTFRYPIPFKSSIHIQFGNSSDAAINFWSDVGYRTGRPHLGYKLTNAGSWVSAAQAVTNGAIGCGTVGTDGVINNGSSSFTSASSTFTGGAGQRIVIGGASSNPGNALYTFINTVNSPTNVTLAAPNNSGNNLSGATFKWGTDAQSNGSTQFLNLGSGQGVAVWHMMTCGATTGIAAAKDTYLETNLVWYLNGNTPLTNGGISPGGNVADVDVNGTEDYFGAGFYWGAGAAGSTLQNNPLLLPPYTAVSNKVAGGLSAAIDLLEAYGGISWTNGVLCRWEQGPRISPGSSFTPVFVAWNIMYYVPY